MTMEWEFSEEYKQTMDRAANRCDEMIASGQPIPLDGGRYSYSAGYILDHPELFPDGLITTEEQRQKADEFQGKAS